MLSMLFIISLAACGNNNTATTSEDLDGITQTVKLTNVLSSIEYSMWTKVMVDGDTSLDNTTTSKDGVFVILYDPLANRQRYYIQGYLDKTKCCDWEWEIDPEQLTEIPKVGSRVHLTGTLVKNESALDGYWLTNIKDFKVVSEWKGLDQSVDYDLRVLNGTLAYVQLSMIFSDPEQFQGKSIIVYGRVYSLTSSNESAAIQHPYYNDYWILDINSEQTLPAIGTNVIIKGTVGHMVINDATYEKSDFSF